jgi:catechol 2,3-dioxygenase-like lactoylglutathione lyase family enzyme
MTATIQTTAARETKLPSIVAQIHDGYPISDLARSMRFYTEVLRLQVIPRPEMPIVGAWLSDEGGGIEIHLFESNQLKPGSAAAPSNVARHTAYVVDDLDAWREHLRAQSAPFMEMDNLIGRPQLFITDPDGHTFEFQQAPG